MLLLFTSRLCFVHAQRGTFGALDTGIPPHGRDVTYQVNVPDQMHGHLPAGHTQHYSCETCANTLQGAKNEIPQRINQIT